MGCARVCSTPVSSWIIWRQNGRDGRNIFENTLQIVHVVFVQYRSSSADLGQLWCLKSDFRMALCSHRDQIFYLVLNVINLPKATELEQTHISVSES